MSSLERQMIKLDISEAYKSGQNTYAYYLELCLKTNEKPRD